MEQKDENSNTEDDRSQDLTNQEPAEVSPAQNNNKPAGLNDSEQVAKTTPNTTDNHEVNKPGRGKKMVFVFALLAIVIISAVIAYVYYSQKSSESTVSKYAAEISYISGQVEKSVTKGIWIELKTSDTVRQGDSVRVNGEGRAIITLDDGSAVRLTNTSVVKLTSLDPKNIEITNEKGEVYTRVVKADRPFIVRVGDESFRSLGTAYKTVNDEAEKGVFVYASKVMDVSKNVEIAEGKKLYKEYEAKTSLVDKVLNMSADEIAKDEFVQWNKQLDQKDDVFKKDMGILETKTTVKKTEAKDTDAAPSTAGGTISLYGSASSTGINLSWTTSGVDTSKGFKIVKSTSINPVYPGDSYIYLESGNNYAWKITNGATYYFRVCQYTGSGCGVYSNNVQIKAPQASDGAVSSIYLTGTGSNINWTVNGYSEKGFKIVWSKTAHPTYPTRSTDVYHYDPSPSARAYTLYKSDGSGKYFVRVCEYLGGSCGKYSNEISVTL